jgi:hypothetical protein
MLKAGIPLRGCVLAARTHIKRPGSAGTEAASLIRCRSGDPKFDTPREELTTYIAASLEPHSACMWARGLNEPTLRGSQWPSPRPRGGPPLGELSRKKINPSVMAIPPARRA